jgi:RHS repeat-associated protein
LLWKYPLVIVSCHKFTAKERDIETGLDFFGARYYSSSQGRFGSIDPSNKSIQAQNPQTWNRYSYCLNDPLLYVDKNGKWPTKKHNTIIETAFPTLDKALVQAMQKGSARVDVDGVNPKTLWEKNAYQHAMTPGARLRN